MAYTQTLDTLTAKLQGHFEPAPPVIAERFHFHRRNQQEGESVAAYIVELKRLADSCKFAGFLNEALRDRKAWENVRPT